MASQSGFRFLLKTPLDETVAKQDGIPDLTAFSTVGGFQSNSVDIGATEIDITNKSTGENRTILDRHGIRTLNTTGSGILQDTQLAKNIEQNVIDQDLRWFVLQREDGRSFISKFKMSSYNFSGTHDGAVTFSITLMSSGTLYIEDSSGFKYDTGTNRITAFNNIANTLRYKAIKSDDYAFASIPDDRRQAVIDDIRNYGILTAGNDGNQFGYKADGTAYGSTDPNIVNKLLQFYQVRDDSSSDNNHIFAANAQTSDLKPERIIINDEIITEFDAPTNTTINNVHYRIFRTTHPAKTIIENGKTYRIQLDKAATTGTTDTEPVFDKDVNVSEGLYGKLIDTSSQLSFNSGANVPAGWTLPANLGSDNMPFYISSIDNNAGIMFRGTGSDGANARDFMDNLIPNIAIISRDSTGNIRSVRLGDLTKNGKGNYALTSDALHTSSSNDVDYAIVNTNILTNLNINTGLITTTQQGAGEESIFLRNVPINTAPVMDAMPNTAISLSGSATQDEFAFPVIALRTGDIEQRTVQVLDSLDQVVDLQPLGFYYVLGISYSVYFIDTALGHNETLDVKIQAG